MMEHLEKRKIPKNFGKDKMGEKHPPIPYQPNSCDCGLFLLHYVELIFRGKHTLNWVRIKELGGGGYFPPKPKREYSMVWGGEVGCTEKKFAF